MGSMSAWHWLVVLLVIILLFGAKKIPELAKGLGSGIKLFKKELDDDKDGKKEEVVKKDSGEKIESGVINKVDSAVANTNNSGVQKVEVIEAQVIESTPNPVPNNIKSEKA